MTRADSNIFIQAHVARREICLQVKICVHFQLGLFPTSLRLSSAALLLSSALLLLAPALLLLSPAFLRLTFLAAFVWSSSLA